MTNDDPDRHVLAVAARCGAPIIVTFNLRHFGPMHLTKWGVRAPHPQAFLADLYRQEPAIVMAKLERQVTERRRALRDLLAILRKTAPEFVRLVSHDLPHT